MREIPNVQEEAPMNIDLAGKVAAAVRLKIDLRRASLRDEHFYSCLPLCVIDAVFSISARYASTRKVVIRWADAQNPKWDMDRRKSVREYSVSEFISNLADKEAETLASTIFKNRQRTSTRNGILKAEAVRLFAKALQKAGIDRFRDMEDAERVERARRLVLDIPGQKSGISFDYFALLAGQPLVKADRMVCRFVADAVGEPTVVPGRAREGVIGAARILKAEFPHIDTRLLDSEIWAYESNRAALRRIR
jgi:hypothetical protein